MLILAIYVPRASSGYQSSLFVVITIFSHGIPLHLCPLKSLNATTATIWNQRNLHLQFGWEEINWGNEAWHKFGLEKVLQITLAFFFFFFPFSTIYNTDTTYGECETDADDCSIEYTVVFFFHAAGTRMNSSS